MKQQIDIQTWERRETYLFFRDFPNPHYSITVRLDVTKARERARAAGVRISHYLLYASLRAANAIEQMRLRQIDSKVWLFDMIRLNTPVSMPDHSFRSVLLPCPPTLQEFAAQAEHTREAVLRGEGDAYSADAEKDTFCISIMPWLDFTSVSYQFGHNAGEQIPLSNLGKMVEQDGRWSIAASTRFHHGFVDGYHASRYFEEFQKNLDTL